MPPETATLFAPSRPAPAAGTPPVAPGDLNARLKHLARLVSRANDLRDPATRSLVQDLLRELNELHGLGLQRIFAVLEDHGDLSADEVREELFADRTVRGLLLAHDLHPQSLEERLDQAIAELGHQLRGQGGAVELIALHDGVARLRLRAPATPGLAPERVVRAALDEFCPDLAGCEIERASAAAAKPTAPAHRIPSINTSSPTPAPALRATR